MGIISSRQAQGNNIARNRFHPRKKITAPARTSSIEKRARKSSAPNRPRMSHPQAGYEHHYAGPGWPGNEPREAIALLPDYVGTEERDKEAVREIGIMPPLADKVNDRGPVEPDTETRQDAPLPERNRFEHGGHRRVR